MNKHLKKPRNEEMYKAILTLNTVEELMKFFDDLCTVSELQAMEQRYQVAVLLSEGMIYNDILEKTGASSATISRVNRSLLNGTDAYDMVCNGVEVGAALLRFLLQKHWLVQAPGYRELVVTDSGKQALQRLFNISLS